MKSAACGCELSIVEISVYHKLSIILPLTDNRDFSVSLDFFHQLSIPLSKFEFDAQCEVWGHVAPFV